MQSKNRVKLDMHWGISSVHWGGRVGGGWHTVHWTISSMDLGISPVHWGKSLVHGRDNMVCGGCHRCIGDD